MARDFVPGFDLRWGHWLFMDRDFIPVHENFVLIRACARNRMNDLSIF